MADGNSFILNILTSNILMVFFISLEKNIKVRDFAKLSLAHFAQPKNNNETKSDASVNLLPVDIETISLSSEDDKKPINKKRPVKRLQIPKLSGNITRSSAKKRRKNKFTLQEKYHKIDKYFLATKTGKQIIFFPLDEIHSFSHIQF